jgi:cell division protein FtsB
MRPHVSALVAPSARSPATSAPHAAPRSGSQPLAILVLERVRWDRVGRLALLTVLVAIVYLYLSAGVRMFSTYREVRADRASVATLAREHAALERRHRELSEQATVEAEARRLGMARRGEQQYVVNGLPAN